MSGGVASGPRAESGANGVLGVVELRLLLVAFVLATRLPLLLYDTHLSKDGPLYVAALHLDRSYAVPPPGNPGFVLAARLLSVFTRDGGSAYALLGVVLSVVGILGQFELGRRFFSSALAAAAAAALATSTLVWCYATAVESYLVWLAVFPILGATALDTARGRSRGLPMFLTWAVGILLRPDMLLFGGAVVVAALALGKAPPRTWIIGLMTAAASILAVVAFMSWVLGGVPEYLATIARQSAHHAGFGPLRAGFTEGFVRNLGKWLLFWMWTAPVAILVALVGSWLQRGRLRAAGRLAILAACWVAPALLFSVLQFTGTAGLVFPALPLTYLLAASGAVAMARWSNGRVRPVTTLLVVAALSCAQFLFSPLLEVRNQRDAILNVMFFNYTLNAYTRPGASNLSDYGIDASARNTLRQLVRPEPLPDRTP